MAFTTGMAIILGLIFILLIVVVLCLAPNTSPKDTVIFLYFAKSTLEIAYKIIKRPNNKVIKSE